MSTHDLVLLTIVIIVARAMRDLFISETTEQGVGSMHVRSDIDRPYPSLGVFHR